MLYLDIQGKAPRRRCKRVIEWFKAKYMPRHHLDITVVHRGLKREGAVGFCTVMDCDHRPREFLIEMETTLSEDLYCQTLLHELWHVYQHVIGTLVISVVFAIGRTLILITCHIRINHGNRKHNRWRSNSTTVTWVSDLNLMEQGHHSLIA